MKHKVTSLLLLLCAILISACTSMRVDQTTAPRKPVKLIYIEQHQDSDFDEVRNVIDTTLQQRGIQTKVVPQGTAPADAFVLSYSAANGWDLVSFLKHVELRLKEGNRLVSTATYHHHGGYALTKYGSTKGKITPLVNQLVDKVRTR